MPEPGDSVRINGVMTRHTLPAQPAPLIGREDELVDVTARLTDPECRLLTIVGPGGVGKTRLAIEAARTVDAFADGVHFVNLQPVEPSDFLVALADALPLSLSGQKPLENQLLTYLREKDALLLLDNFEHLVEEAPFLSRLLSEAALAKLLVTSRTSLNMQQEWLYPLHGLPVPPSETTAEVSGYGAVRLFQERVRHVRPDFTLEGQRRAVVRICRLVEGLPLALELAASWARTLDCAEIADEIECNLDFLSRPLRDLPERHHSMQAVFAQTWSLLPEEERHVFRRLSVFRGGFQRAAATAVAGASLAVLSRLVDRCLVRRERRYQIHELLRQFGEEKLRALPEEAEATRQRHVDYYADFLAQRTDAIQSLYQRQAVAEIAQEWDNVRAAWQRAVSDGNVDAIGRAASTFFSFCQQQNRFLEGATALKAAAASIEQEPASRERDLVLARLFNHEGWLRIRVGDFDRARKILEQSHTLYQEYDAAPPPYMGTDSSVPLAVVALIKGDAVRSIALCESARQAAEARQDTQNLAFAHYGLCAAKLSQGDYNAAYDHGERACTLAREAGNRWFLAYPLIEWGNVARAIGNYEEAERHYRAGHALHEEFEASEGMAVALNHLGEIAVYQERHREAARLFRQSLELYRDLNDRGGLATCLKGLAQVAYVRQEFSTAGERFREALQIATEIAFWPLLCAIVVDVAALLSSLDRPALAVALLTLIRQHPAIQEEISRRAEQQLEKNRSQMEAAEFAAAVQRGEGWNLEAALTKLDAELTAVTERDATLTRADEQPLVEPLTDREQDILHLLARGYTNSEIAEELVLAVGTVKWYASQIYGKLGVSNRTEAAARARNLDLVPN
jgi:predicted ATPase/DNA-binding NarL/FixJ family response regulator